MATYVVGGILLVLVILAIRSYFGRKAKGELCCGCSACAAAKKCNHKK